MAEVVLTSGPFYANCNPSLSAACGAMVAGQNLHLWGGPSGENPLDDGI